MDTEVVAVFCLCDDILKAHHEDQQCQISDGEVMTIAIVAALYHGGNFELARKWLQAKGYIPNMLGKSCFNRRLHRYSKPISEAVQPVRRNLERPEPQIDLCD